MVVSIPLQDIDEDHIFLMHCLSRAESDERERRAVHIAVLQVSPHHHLLLAGSRERTEQKRVSPRNNRGSQSTSELKHKHRLDAKTYEHRSFENP